MFKRRWNRLANLVGRTTGFTPPTFEPTLAELMAKHAAEGPGVNNPAPTLQPAQITEPSSDTTSLQKGDIVRPGQQSPLSQEMSIPKVFSVRAAQPRSAHTGSSQKITVEFVNTRGEPDFRMTTSDQLEFVVRPKKPLPSLPTRPDSLKDTFEPQTFEERTQKDLGSGSYVMILDEGPYQSQKARVCEGYGNKGFKGSLVVETEDPKTKKKAEMLTREWIPVEPEDWRFISSPAKEPGPEV